MSCDACKRKSKLIDKLCDAVKVTASWSPPSVEDKEKILSLIGEALKILEEEKSYD